MPCRILRPRADTVILSRTLSVPSALTAIRESNERMRSPLCPHKGAASNTIHASLGTPAYIPPKFKKCPSNRRQIQPGFDDESTLHANPEDLIGCDFPSGARLPFSRQFSALKGPGANHGDSPSAPAHTCMAW